MEGDKKPILPLLIVIASVILLLLPFRSNLSSLPFGLYSLGGLSEGNVLLALSWLLAATSIIMLLAYEIKGYKKALKLIPWAIRCTTGFLTFSVILLTYYFLKSDFSINYVWQFSSTTLPTVYKLSAVWAGQEGTYLLWAWLIFVYTWIIQEKSGLENTFIRKSQIINLLIGIFFITLTILVTPFKTLYEIYPDVTPELVASIEGNGLNPLLRDPWMAVHPPVIFIAYAAVTITLSGALVYLSTGEATWESYSKQWNRFAWLFLTLGIAVGGFWSYKVLGWGGYWAWDPVETSSFIPWLTLTGLLHASVQYKRRGDFKIFSPFLAVITFLLVVYATFITRSGLWESVHAFAQTTTGPWLAFLMVNIAFVSLILGIDFYRRNEGKITQVNKDSINLICSFISSQFVLALYKKFLEKGGSALPTFRQAIFIFALTFVLFLILRRVWDEGEDLKSKNSNVQLEEKEEEEKIELLTRENLFYIAVVLLSVLAFVSFWGITYPMLVQARTGAKISVGVEFFNKWSLPFTALLMLAMGFCLLYSKINKDKLTRMAAGVIIATAVSIIVKPTANLYINSLGPLALFGGMGAIYRIVHGISSPKTLKGKLRQASIYLIHLGLALILIGTLISAVYEAEMSTSFTFPDEKGIKRSILMGYAIAVNDIEVYLTQDGWWATAIELGVYKDDKYIGGGLAESIDDRKFGKVTHVYINRGLFSDVYVIFQGLATQRPGSVIVPLTVKIIPGVGILWLGIVLLSVGILPLIIIETRLEIPPVRYSRMIAEDSAGQVSNPDREYLEKSLAELRKSYEEGKISKKAYKTLKKQYEKALEES